MNNWLATEEEKKSEHKYKGIATSQNETEKSNWEIMKQASGEAGGHRQQWKISATGEEGVRKWMTNNVQNWVKRIKHQSKKIHKTLTKNT